MSNGYGDFFKAAKGAKGPPKAPRKEAAPAPSSQSIKKPSYPLRTKEGHPLPKKRKIKSPPLSSMIFAAALFGLAGWYYARPDDFEKFWAKIEVRAFGSATANEEAKSSPPKEEKGKKSAESEDEEEKPAASNSSEGTDENLSYFSKLSERKKELDLREKQLNELEEELHKQRDEVEARIRKLEEMRVQIAVVLKERVQADDEKVNRLVDIFSNMKPQQAAKILGEVDESLAVEAIGRMKKKTAAEILNLLPAAKAQVLSEKFAGYKKK